MGRKAGVEAQQTRDLLLRSAASVFARRGYGGASIAEITSEAGLTSGAVYAHYGSKAELFVAALRSHGERELERLLCSGEPVDLPEVLRSLGASLDGTEPAEGSLVVTAIQTARDDPEVEALLRTRIAERERLFAGIVAEAQGSGAITPGISSAAIARLSLMLSFGSLLVAAIGLEAPDHCEWERAMDALVGAFLAPPG